MSANVAKIIAEALDLTPKDRALVAELLLESLEVEPKGDLSPEWQEEVRKRCEEIDRGLVELRPAEEVFSRARAELERL